jgi:hypothetical protein
MRISEWFSFDHKFIFFMLLFMCRCSALIRAVLNGANILMLECSYPSPVLYTILSFSLTNYYFNCFFFVKLYIYIYLYAVKNILINPSNREELGVDKLTMLFNCPDYWVGTTIEPNVPDGISKMFVFVFIFFFFLLRGFFFFINCELFLFFLLFNYLVFEFCFFSYLFSIELLV